MKYFYDTEFLEDGHTIDLISIGIVAEDGRELYCVSNEFDMDAVIEHPWLYKHVLPTLPTKIYEGDLEIDVDHPAVMTRTEIAQKVREFILGPGDGSHTVPDVELWAYYADYDHVALCQLYGRMIDLPEGMPMYTKDLKQEIDRLGMEKKDLPVQTEGTEHNALTDAHWNRLAWNRIEHYRIWGHNIRAGVLK